MGDFDDMIPEYITESTELLADVEGGFLALEEGTADEDTVHTVFRAIHSIKGGAGFVGLGKIERLAHKMEDLLGLLRNHDMEATPEVTNTLLKSMDVLRLLFDNVEEMDSVDIEPSLAALVKVLERDLSDNVRQDASTQALPQDVAGIPTFDVSVYTLKNALHQGNVFYLKLDLASLEKRGIAPMNLVAELLSMGEILDANFNLSANVQDYEDVDLSVDVLYSTVLESDLLMTALYLEEGEARLLSDKDFELANADDSTIAMPVNPTSAIPVAEALKSASAPKPKSEEPPARAVAPPPDSPPRAPAEAPLKAPAERDSYAEITPVVWEDKDYLTFRLENEIYAVDILRVQEIIGVPHMARLPRSREDVLGVMNLRGMVVPVFDLRIRLNLNFDPKAPAVVVVMRLGEKIMGGIVDEVRDVLHIKGADVQDAPLFAPVGKDGGADSRVYCLAGLSEQGRETVIILDVDKLYAVGES